MSDPLLWNLATYAFAKIKKSMRSLTTGIGFCKTKFHLSRGEHMVVSSADFFQILVMLSGFCIYVLAPSATLDMHLKKRTATSADDEKLRNSFNCLIVGRRIVAFLKVPIKGTASQERGGCF